MFKIVKSSTWTEMKEELDQRKSESRGLRVMLEDRKKQQDAKISGLQIKLHETKMALETCKTRKEDLAKDCDQYQKTLSKANEEIAERGQEIKLLKARVAELERRECPELDTSILVKTKTRIEGALKELSHLSRGRKSAIKNKVQAILSQAASELSDHI